MAESKNPLDDKKVIGLIGVQVTSSKGEVTTYPLVDVHTLVVEPLPCIIVVEFLENRYYSTVLDDELGQGGVTVTSIAGKAKFVYGPNDTNGMSFVWVDADS